MRFNQCNSKWKLSCLISMTSDWLLLIMLKFYINNFDFGTFPSSKRVNTAASESHAPTPTAYVRPRVPHLSWTFAFLPIFPPTICFCLWLVPHSRISFSPGTSFYPLYFPVVLSRTSLPKILLSICPVEGLSPVYFPHPSTLFSHVLPFPPAFPYPVFLFVPVLPMFVPHFPSQNPLEPTRSGPSSSVTSSPFPLEANAEKLTLG